MCRSKLIASRPTDTVQMLLHIHGRVEDNTQVFYTVHCRVSIGHEPVDYYQKDKSGYTRKHHNKLVSLSSC